MLNTITVKIDTYKCPKCKKVGLLGTSAIGNGKNFIKAMYDKNSKYIISCICGYRSGLFNSFKKLEDAFENFKESEK